VSQSLSLGLPHVFVSSLVAVQAPAPFGSGRPAFVFVSNEHGVVAGSLFLRPHTDEQLSGLSQSLSLGLPHVFVSSLGRRASPRAVAVVVRAFVRVETNTAVGAGSLS